MDFTAHIAQNLASFRKMYRMTPEAFLELANKITPFVIVNEKMAIASTGAPIPVELRLSLTIRFLAGGSYLDIFTKHQVGISTVYEILWDTCEAIGKAIPINFPFNSTDEMEKLEREFSSKCKGQLAGCVGAIDGLAIKIEQPKLTDAINPKSYYNRKGFFSMNLQAMCDATRKFTYASLKCCGSTHDSLAFAVSTLAAFLDSGKLPSGYWIAADEAYALSEQMITPYSGNGLPQDKDAFNFLLSSLRINIECAFGMLVQRWGVLWRKLRVSLPHCCLVVFTCILLHNYCIDTKQVLPDESNTATWFYQDEVADAQRQPTSHSNLRDHLCSKVRELGLIRPVESVLSQ
jgi:hypothetical protein